MSSDDRHIAGGGAWWLLFVLWALYSLSYFDRYVITILVDPIKHDLDLSDFQMSLILGPAFAVSYALVTLPVGFAVDRFKRRAVAFAGAQVWSLATVASALAQTFAGLFAARVCVAAGEAALTPSAYSLIAQRFPKQNLTTAFAIYGSGVKIGSAAAFGIGGLLLSIASSLQPITLFGAELRPWQMVMVIVGLPGFLLGPLLFTIAEPRIRGPNETPARQMALWPFVKEHSGLLARLVGGFSVVTICPGALIAWTPTYLSRHYGWSALQYGTALSAISLIAAVALILKGGLVDWLYARGMTDAPIRFYCWLLIGGIPIALAGFLIENPFVFLICYGVVQIVTLPFLVYANSAISLFVPSQLIGRISAVLLVTFNVVGPGLGPMVVGALTDHLFRDESKIGYSLALTLGFCMPVALVILWSSLGRLRDAVAAAEAEAI